jgi:hypothetical protein
MHSDAGRCEARPLVSFFPSPLRRPTIRNVEMSSSNLAERMERPATDSLSDQPRFEVRVAANDERAVRKVRRTLSFTNRKFVVRDQGLKLLLIR